MVDRYNESKGKKKAKPQRPGAEGGESGGEHEASGHDEIKHVAMEHGAAHDHLITKNEDGRGYHSETHHEDGHVHHADHDTLEEAHEHGAHAMDDAEHLGDMDRDDSDVAQEEGALESHPSRRTSNVGFMK